MSQPNDGQRYISFLVEHASGTDLLETYIEDSGTKVEALSDEEYDALMERIEQEAEDAIVQLIGSEQ